MNVCVCEAKYVDGTAFVGGTGPGHYCYIIQGKNQGKITPV